jgi:hypothetical protein
MKHLLIILALANSLEVAWSQKTIKGAYEGELVVPKSVLLINHHKDSVLKGMVYSSQLEHVPFYGLYTKQTIRGTIFMPPDQGDIVILYGKLNKDTIDITLVSSIDSTVIVKSKLLKVSNSVNYNLEKTYGKVVPRYDGQLVGTWLYLHAIQEDGQKIKVDPMIAGMTVEYLANGLFTVNSPRLAELTAKYSAPVGQRAYVRMTWFTQEGKLVTKTEIHFPPGMMERAAQMGLPVSSLPDASESVTAYQIKGDTLIKTDSKMMRTYFIKKK